MRRKLLAIFRKFNFFGAVNNSIDLILNLDQSKFDIKVVFLKRESSEQGSSYINQLKDKGIKFYFLDSFLDINFRFINRIPNAMKLKLIKYNWYKFLSNNSGFDIIYSNDHLTDYEFLNSELIPNKTIYHIHYSKSFETYLSKRILKVYKEALLNIVNNELNKKELIKLGIAENKILNFGLAIQHENWISDDQKYKKIRIENNIKDDQLVVCGSGDITIRKGTDIFYETYKLVMQNSLQNKVKFIWLGNVSTSEESKNMSILLKKKMEQIGIKVFNSTNTPYEIFNMIDVFIVSSRKEVGPLTLLECMSLKKLVVSHKNCGIVSTALNQNSGIIVNENKSELYFDAINKILKNYKNYYEFRENAFNKVENKFSFKSKKNEIENFI